MRWHHVSFYCTLRLILQTFCKKIQVSGFFLKIFFPDYSAIAVLFLDLTCDSFTKTILAQLAILTDPKPGRVFREILPIVQSATPVITPQINVNVRRCVIRFINLQ